MTDFKLPNLFVPGAGKSGTSSLHEYLAQHPNISMSSKKEPHFFLNQDINSQSLENYSRLFSQSDEVVFRGESSTGYMIFSDVIENINKYILNPKFIFILRNPVERAYSHYTWLKGMGFEDEDFRSALLKDMNDKPDPKNHINVGYKYYYQSGCYAKYLSEYIKVYGLDNIHIITTESLRIDPLSVLNSCFSFLGLTPLKSINKVVANPTVQLRWGSFYKSMLNGNYGIIRKILKPIVSRRVKNKMYRINRSLAMKLRTSLLQKKSSFTSISSEDKLWLVEKYVEDVKKLRELTRNDFKDWFSDFPK